MRMIGIALASIVIGIISAVMVLTMFPWLTEGGFALVAVIASGAAFAIIAWFKAAAENIEVRGHYSWDGQPLK